MSDDQPVSGHCVECVYCAGRGCEECGGTGERWTHLLEVDGMSAVIHGSAPLDAESQDAMVAVMRAAFEHLGSEEITDE